MAAYVEYQLEDGTNNLVDVTFGLKTIGEVGNFAVGKVGVEANYPAALKWNNKEE